MNTFYGKSVNEMNFNELTLLSVDLQIQSFNKVNNVPQSVIDQSNTIREGLMFKCQTINSEFDYSRERFLHDFNGTNPMMLETPYDEFVEVQFHLN